jgi:MraZ protein
VFLGTHHPRLDDKGRLFLPAKFRDQLAGGVVVTRGQEHSLFVFPREVFSGLTDQMSEAPLSSKGAREYMRVLLSGASDEVPDRQGRITLPATLRSYAGLTKECVVIGMGVRLEIWDAAAWEQYLSEKEPEFASLSEEVLPGLF